MDISPDKITRLNGLKAGKGLQHLLNEACVIFGNPILIHDMDYKAVAFSENIVTDDPIWNEYAAKGTVGYEWLDFFKKECFLEAAANAKSITFLTSDQLKYDRIFGKVFNKNNIQVGCAVMVACNKNFEYESPMLFEKFCAILSTELGLDTYYTDYGQIYFEKLIGELIAGVSDIALYTAHVESIYMHLKSNLYLAVADTGMCDPSYDRLASCRDLLKKKQPGYTYAVYAGHILILISTDDPQLYVERDLKPLNLLFQKRNMYAGVSCAFENLFDLNKYYNQAFSALGNGTRGSRQHFFLHDPLSDHPDD